MCKDGCMQVDSTDMGSCPAWMAEVGVLEKENGVIQLRTRTMYLVFDGMFIVNIVLLH